MLAGQAGMPDHAIDNARDEPSEWKSAHARRSFNDRDKPDAQPPFAFDYRDPAPPRGSAPLPRCGRALGHGLRRAAADPPPAPPVLHLADGGFAAGEVRDIDQARRPALAGRVVRRPVRVRDQGRQRHPVAAAGDARPPGRRLLLRAGRRRRALRVAGRPGREARSSWTSPGWAGCTCSGRTSTGSTDGATAPT